MCTLPRTSAAVVVFVFVLFSLYCDSSTDSIFLELQLCNNERVKSEEGEKDKAAAGFAEAMTGASATTSRTLHGKSSAAVISQMLINVGGKKRREGGQ